MKCTSNLVLSLCWTLEFPVFIFHPGPTIKNHIRAEHSPSTPPYTLALPFLHSATLLCGHSLPFPLLLCYLPHKCDLLTFSDTNQVITALATKSLTALCCLRHQRDHGHAKKESTGHSIASNAATTAQHRTTRPHCARVPNL